MPPKTLSALKYIEVDVADYIRKRKDWVKYLIVRDKELLKDILASEKFTEFLAQQVDAYINGKVVAAEIQMPVMNVADDILSGREPILRAGDYLALQKCFRSSQTPK
jgi:hypothetical protein